MKNKFPTAPTAPDSCIASDVVIEARATLAVMPTGEWRRSLRTRLVRLEGAIDAWTGFLPSEDERRRVTTQAIHFFCAVKGPTPTG